MMIEKATRSKRVLKFENLFTGVDVLAERGTKQIGLCLNEYLAVHLQAKKYWHLGFLESSLATKLWL